MANDDERQTFDRWFSRVMAKPYDKEELRQQIELRKTENLLPEKVNKMSYVVNVRCVQCVELTESDMPKVVRGREISSVNEFRRWCDLTSEGVGR